MNVRSIPVRVGGEDEAARGPCRARGASGPRSSAPSARRSPGRRRWRGRGRRALAARAPEVHDRAQRRQRLAHGRWEPNARGRLERAALELYGERGFDQTTVAEIAWRAGLTERTFFRHFAAKREVLFAVPPRCSLGLDHLRLSLQDGHVSGVDVDRPKGPRARLEGDHPAAAVASLRPLLSHRDAGTRQVDVAVAQPLQLATANGDRDP